MIVSMCGKQVKGIQVNPPPPPDGIYQTACHQIYRGII